MALANLGGSLHQFGLEASPDSIAILPVLTLEKAKSFFGTQLGDSCEVVDAQPIKDFCTGEFACATTEWAFDVFGIRRLRG